MGSFIRPYSLPPDYPKGVNRPLSLHKILYDCLLHYCHAREGWHPAFSRPPHKAGVTKMRFGYVVGKIWLKLYEEIN